MTKGRKRLLLFEKGTVVEIALVHIVMKKAYTANQNGVLLFSHGEV